MLDLQFKYRFNLDLVYLNSFFGLLGLNYFILFVKMCICLKIFVYVWCFGFLCFERKYLFFVFVLGFFCILGMSYY